MPFAVLASLPAPSAYRNPQLSTFFCVLFITFQPTSERAHHCAHYSRAICSRFGMDSCPVFPHLQITRATLAAASWSWISKGNLHLKTLIKSHSFLHFKGKEVGNCQGSRKHLQFGETAPLLLIYFMPETDQSRGSPAEQGEALFPPIIYPWKQISLNLYCLLLLVLKQPQLYLPPLSTLTLSHWPLTHLQGGKG